MTKEKIAQSFGKAHQSYDQDSPVQRWCAQKLCDLVSQSALPKDANCLEIGCGTGHLTHLITNAIPNGDWLITDLSEQMLKTCRARIGEKPSYRLMDGEHPDLVDKYDLIVSSLAFQWFDDLPAAIEKLRKHLTPKGQLFFTTLGAHSFYEWTDAMERAGLSSGMHDYPSSDQLNDLIQGAEFTSVAKVQEYPNAIGFLKALKAIGAQQPRKGYRPASAGQLRRALSEMDNENSTMTYNVIFGRVTAS